MRPAAARSCSTTATVRRSGCHPFRRATSATRCSGLTFRQHPFPGTLLYWLSRDHVRVTGRYYRLLDAASDPAERPPIGEPATDGA